MVQYLLGREASVARASTSNHARNEQATLQWARSSMQELRVEMRELRASLNSSTLLRQLHVMRNEVSRYYDCNPSQRVDLATEGH